MIRETQSRTMARAGMRQLDSVKLRWLTSKDGGSAPWLTAQGLLWGVATALLMVLVLLPVYHLVFESFRTATGFSLANYLQILQLRRFHEALLNSLTLGLICAVL